MVAPKKVSVKRSAAVQKTVEKTAPAAPQRSFVSAADLDVDALLSLPTGSAKKKRKTTLDAAAEALDDVEEDPSLRPRFTEGASARVAATLNAAKMATEGAKKEQKSA